MVQRRFGREGAEFGRGLGFFDAMYGFAITLLVANVPLPPADAWTSIASLLGSGLGTQLTGFVISFVVIAAFWRHNTTQLSRFSGIDSSIITVNLVSAGLVVLLPFTTRGISDPALSHYPLPVALYATNVGLAILCQRILVEVGRRRGLLIETQSRAEVVAEWVDALSKVAVFAVSIPVAYLVHPSWGMYTWLLLFVVSPIFGKRLARASDAGDAGVAGATGSTTGVALDADGEPVDGGGA